MLEFTRRGPDKGKGMFRYPTVWLESQQRGLSLRLPAANVDNLVEWLNRVGSEEVDALLAQRDRFVESLRVAVLEHAEVVVQRDELADALSELADLVDAMWKGEYEIDYFTTQPARAALALMRGDQ